MKISDQIDAEWNFSFGTLKLRQEAYDRLDAETQFVAASILKGIKGLPQYKGLDVVVDEFEGDPDYRFSNEIWHNVEGVPRKVYDHSYQAIRASFHEAQIKNLYINGKPIKR